jgi:hypothetical protein
MAFGIRWLGVVGLHAHGVYMHLQGDQGLNVSLQYYSASIS